MIDNAQQNFAVIKPSQQQPHQQSKPIDIAQQTPSPNSPQQPPPFFSPSSSSPSSLRNQPLSSFKPTLHQFHQQIRTTQRSLIKQSLRVQKYEKDIENLYWERQLSEAIEEELREELMWEGLGEEREQEEREFWESVGRGGQEG